MFSNPWAECYNISVKALGWMAETKRKVGKRNRESES